MAAIEAAPALLEGGAAAPPSLAETITQGVNHIQGAVDDVRKVYDTAKDVHHKIMDVGRGISRGARAFSGIFKKRFWRGRGR